MRNHRNIKLPHVPPAGKLNVDDLFCDIEQPIFDFYEKNARRYKTVLDVGANIGAHTILMARRGWAVHAFEPDPQTFAALCGNVVQNDAHAMLHETALGVQNGTVKFVRVLDNLFASHVAGYKASYGPRAEIEVEVVDARPWFEMADFAKIDAEGMEADLLTLLPDNRLDVLVEISNAENATRIYNHARLRRYRMWRHHAEFGWQEVFHLPELPARSTHGMLFLGREAP